VCTHAERRWRWNKDALEYFGTQLVADRDKLHGHKQYAEREQDERVDEGLVETHVEDTVPVCPPAKRLRTTVVNHTWDMILMHKG